MSEYHFWKIGHIFTGHKLSGSQIQGERKFKTFFGCSASICGKIWSLISAMDINVKPKHLLMGLHFLKQYNNEHVNAALFDCSETTFRYYSWKVIELLANMDVVSAVY